jgi:hypothetical protein
MVILVITIDIDYIFFYTSIKTNYNNKYIENVKGATLRGI